MRRPMMVVVLSVLAGFAVGCSGASFSAAPDNGNEGLIGGNGGTPPGGTCDRGLQTTTAPVRVLMMVDTSGSNLSNGNFGGSDPDKSWRGESIESFFRSYQMRANFSWSFGTFRNNMIDHLTDAPHVSGLFASAGRFSSALNLFYTVQDEGNTPYLLALEDLQDQVLLDGARTQDTKYIVVFISDGLPFPEVAESVLLSTVRDLVGSAPGQVTFNAIYYGVPSAEASGRLQRMAQEGRGGFYDATRTPGQVFPIDDVIQVPAPGCP